MRAQGWGRVITVTGGSEPLARWMGRPLSNSAFSVAPTFHHSSLWVSQE